MGATVRWPRLPSRYAAGALTLAIALGTLAGAGGAAAGGAPRYLDPHQPLAARVQDLLRRMTLTEKIGQLVQIEVTQVTDQNDACTSQGGFNLPNPVCEEKIFVAGAVGSILAGGSDIPLDTTGAGGPGNTGRDWAFEYNTMQRYAIEHSRLHIPVVFGVDAVHGFGHPYQAPLFPQSIGMGATWNPALAKAGGAVTGAALRATGWTWNFAPDQDIARDNRWGRTFETWSEAPVLAAAMGAASVTGLQAEGVAATVKHFAGYSQSVNGHDRVQAELPIRYLQDTLLPSYAGAIAAGAQTVMINSGSINGVPATSSRFLQTELLRHRLGFNGVIISDFGDVTALANAYHVAPDLAGAAAQAINAGLDVAMLPFGADQWQAALLEDVRTGAISRRRIDESVRRVLTLKFRLGLFDHPYVDVAAADAAVTAGREATRQAASESITLLRNENSVLPLAAGARIVVTGPSADSMTNQLGGWSVSWQGVFGAGHVCCMGPANQIPPGTTVLAGLRALDPNVVYAPSQAAAVTAAGSADAVVVAVGERAYAEGLGDDPAPQLPPDQKALIAALAGTGKPVIVVVLAGRPLGLGPGTTANALLMAYQGSTEAGAAVADVIFGRVNPSGHLPLTWPSEAATTAGDFNGGGPSPIGDQPKTYDQLPSTSFAPGNAYNPLFPIGFGLSYTTFRLSNLSVTPTTGRTGTVTATVTVTNTGTRAGATVIPVYVHRPLSTVIAPIQRLAGFTKVSLAAGESRTVRISFPVSVLAVTPGDIDAAGPPAVETGNYEIVVPDLPAAAFTVHG